MKRKDTLAMSMKEIDKLKILHQVIKKQLKQRQAGRQLDLSTRQIRRLCNRIRREGNTGVIHRLRGQPSNHQLDAGVLEEAIDYVKTRYKDFGPTYANEKINGIHKIYLSTGTLRRGMIEAGLWKPRQQGVQHRVWRERRHCVGELVQLDGSDHDWFEGRGPRCVLLIFIDDATSRILYGEFITVENTVNLLAATKSYLLSHGRPLSFYVDKDSIYKINRQATIEEELRDEQPLTQFTRAMKELNVQVIAANSPQAKGRVERGFKTHQDRLVKELRLAGISNRQDATRFLQDIYIPDHNRRCAIDPASPTDAHRPLLPTHRLHEILSIRIQRVVANDFTLRFHAQFFQLTKEQPLRIRPDNKVFIEVRLDGSTHIRFKDRYLNFKRIPKKPYTATYLNRKPLIITVKSKPYKPPPSHPWKANSFKKRIAREAMSVSKMAA